MTSPNTIIADMQLVETNLRQQIAHLNDEIAGLKSDVALFEKHMNRLLTACEIFMSHGVCEISYYAIRDAIKSVKGSS